MLSPCGSQKNPPVILGLAGQGDIFLNVDTCLAIHNYHYNESLSGEASHLFTWTHLQGTPSQMPPVLRRDI